MFKIQMQQSKQRLNCHFRPNCSFVYHGTMFKLVLWQDNKWVQIDSLDQEEEFLIRTKMHVWFNLTAYASGYRFRRQYDWGTSVVKSYCFYLWMDSFHLVWFSCPQDIKKVRKMSSVGALIEPRGGSYQRWRHPFLHNYLSVSSCSPLNWARGWPQTGPKKMPGRFPTLA